MAGETPTNNEQVTSRDLNIKIYSQTQALLKIILGWTAVITFGPQELSFFISTIITLPLGPVYQLLLSLPLLMVLDVISERRRRYVTRFAERKGIRTTLSVSIHEKK